VVFGQFAATPDHDAGTTTDEDAPDSPARDAAVADSPVSDALEFDARIIPDALVSYDAPTDPDALVAYDAPTDPDALVAYDAPTGPDALVHDAAIGPDAIGQDAVEAGCGTPPVAVVVAPPNRVIPIYLAGSDTPDDVVASELVYFERGLAAAQTWYSQSMAAAGAPRTFRFDPPRILRSSYSHAQWNEFGTNGFPPVDGGPSNCGLWNAASDELSNGPILTNAGLPPLSTAGIVYMAIVGGGGTGGCVAPDLSVIEEMSLTRIEARCPNGTYDGCTRDCTDPGGLADIDPWCKETPHDMPGYGCSSVGGIAYDLGLQFGLRASSDRPDPDRSACAGRTIMDGWWNYGHGATLCDADITDLMATGYFAAP
jgi:hypothetical protein